MYNWLSAINWGPGADNSNLIKTEKAVPTKLPNKAYIKYMVPMSFAFDDKSHLSTRRDIDQVKISNLGLLYCFSIDESLE